jgi:tetratricopeptide (TPR) repeat protein
MNRIPPSPTYKRRLWVMRLVAMIFIPLLILVGLELGLRFAGYGYDPHFFRQIQINGRNFFVPNEKFSHRFFPPALSRTAFPIRFAAEKATNSYRIFLLGESAANGDPDTTYGVGRYLQILLRERFPSVKFEVISVAMTAIDSSTILPIARECAQHHGDLWIIYMGNNEMVGPFGAETSYGLRAPGLVFTRTLLAIKTTRIGQLLDAIGRRLRSNSSTPREWGGMEMFANNRLGYDDPARLRAYANFSGNLEDILRAAHVVKVPVILSTVGVNLKDCAPFASIHATGLDSKQESDWKEIFQEGVDQEAAGSYRKALAAYVKAAQIDPQFAELQFRMGRCDLALTNDDQARREFELARDYDALDFRADARINSAIQKVASRHAGQGVFLLDAAKVMAQGSQDQIPGLEFFYEHVHLNFSGNYLLALNFAEQAKKILPVSFTAGANEEWASAELCDERLAVTAWDRQRVWQPILSRVKSPPFTGQFNHDASLKIYESKLNEAKSLMNTQSPEQAQHIYEQALKLSPDDYFLHGNFERFLEKKGDLAGAIREAKRCCELMPQLPGEYYYAGTLLVRDGKITEATGYFLQTLALRNDRADAQNEMGEILANQQKPAEAIDWFKRAIRANPDYVESYINLGFLQQNQGENDAAMDSYQQAANLELDGPADYFNRANVAATRYQWDEAIACLRAAIKVRPDFWQAHYQLGVQLAKKGELNDTEKQFMEVIRYRPDYCQAHLDLGTVLAKQGKLDQALAEFQTVLQLDPANDSAKRHIENTKAALYQSH